MLTFKNTKSGAVLLVLHPTSPAEQVESYAVAITIPFKVTSSPGQLCACMRVSELKGVVGQTSLPAEQVGSYAVAITIPHKVMGV